MEDHRPPVNYPSDFPMAKRILSSPDTARYSPSHSQAIKNLSGCISFLLPLMSLQLTRSLITMARMMHLGGFREVLGFPGSIEDGVL